MRLRDALRMPYIDLMCAVESAKIDKHIESMTDSLMALVEAMRPLAEAMREADREAQVKVKIDR